MGVLLCKANKTTNSSYNYNRVPTYIEKESYENRREKLYQQIHELFDNVNKNSARDFKDEH